MEGAVSEVGAVGIVLGVVVVCSRGALLVAPARMLHWFEGLVATNSGIRALGAVVLILGGAMIWAGGPGYSGLAQFLLVVGWAFVGISTVALLVFPAVYRAMADAFLPVGADADLSVWRLLGFLGVCVGGLLIYFGVLAL
jgi:hypothetical protein